MEISGRRVDYKQRQVRKKYQNYFYDDFIYIHTTHIFILISFFKDRKDAGQASTKGPCTSNFRGIGGIFAYGGHR